MKTVNPHQKSAGLRAGRTAIGLAGFVALLLCMVSIASSSSAHPQRFEARVVARIVDLKGDVDFQEPGRDWRNARPGMELPSDFDFRTRRNSECTLQFADGQRITVGEDSQVQVRSSIDRGRISRIELELRMGVLRARVESYGSLRADFDINTPNARVDVQGGVFAIRYDERRQTTRIAVDDGRLDVEPTNPSLRPVSLGRGESIEVTPVGINPFRGDFDRRDDDRQPGGPPLFPPQPFIPGGGPVGGVCIADGSGPGSTDRNEHFRWARSHDTPEIEANLRLKLEMLFRCNLLNDSQLSNFFADISVLVGRNAPNRACFNGDRGPTGTDRRKHQDWARDKGRQAMLENIEWKISSALRCMDRERQNRFFADVSVVIAQGRVRM
jgi:hypothetical protein